MLMKKEVIEDNEKLKKEIKDLKKQLEEEKNAYNRMYNRLDKAKEKCKYLLENEQVEINERTYIKQTADDIITRYIYESLEGKDKE